jgi:hypothetical protein
MCQFGDRDKFSKINDLYFIYPFSDRQVSAASASLAGQVADHARLYRVRRRA